MGTRQPPHQNPPPVQRLRLQYAKRGTARFASHRDFSRVFERALRRADVPMAYSSGFTPHPRISYMNAAPTGAASEAEYLEIGLAEKVSPEKLVAALNKVIPHGFVIIKAVEADGQKLKDKLKVSQWFFKLPEEVDQESLTEALTGFKDADEVLVVRETKKGQRTFDARSAVLEIKQVPQGLDVILKHVEPLVRPDDVLQALNKVCHFVTPEDVLFDRLKQGELVDGQITDPLAKG